MDEQRVEIELTPRDHRRGRHRSSSAAVAPLIGNDPGQPPPGFESGTSSAPEPAPPPNERRRLVVTGLTVGVVALFIGWALGRAGDSPGDGAAEAEPTGTSRPAADGEPSIDPAIDQLSTVAPVDDDLLPSTTAVIVRVPEPRPPTTTAPPPEWVQSFGRVSPEAAGLDISIVGVQPDGDLVDLDTGSGDLWMLSSTPRERFGVSAVYAGDGWTLVRNVETNEAVAYTGHDGGFRYVLPGDPWTFFQQPGGPNFWTLPTPPRWTDPGIAREVTFEGEPTGVEFTVDTRFWIPGADPAGGLVSYGAPGGTYHLSVDGSSRITTGDVLALGRTVALANQCGETLDDCGLVVIDRGTGEARDLDLFVAQTTTAAQTRHVYESAANYGISDLLGGVSHDGHYAPLIVTDTDTDYGLIDLVTGEFFQLGDAPESGIWWSPDSRYAMYLLSGHLMMLDLTTKTVSEVSTDVFPLQSFTVRQGEAAA